ncbi:hypothetical protein HDU97_004614 [Phlyctochytrium planicorne]|nr:hypothetical protein HDU97_004614 [Phlyctochytrium planicorne]
MPKGTVDTEMDAVGVGNDLSSFLTIWLVYKHVKPERSSKPSNPALHALAQPKAKPTAYSENVISAKPDPWQQNQVGSSQSHRTLVNGPGGWPSDYPLEDDFDIYLNANAKDESRPYAAITRAGASLDSASQVVVLKKAELCMACFPELV